MESKMKQAVMQKIRPEGQRNMQRETVRNGAFSILLMTASLIAASQMMGGKMPYQPVCMAAGVLAVLCMAIASLMKRKYTVAGKLWLLPWLFLLICYRPAEYMRGFQWWINQILSGWNQAYDGGIALYQVQNTARDHMAISLFLVIVCAELSWKLVAENRTFFCAIFVFVLMVLQMMSGSESLWNCALLLFLLLTLMLSGGAQFPGRSFYWELGILFFLVISGVTMNDSRLKSVTELRTSVEEGIREMRYGNRSLPEGDLNQASVLRESTDEMMTVETGQEKSLYLRAFTGGTYDPETGSWYPLSGTAYGNQYSGMLEWLKNQGFDPLTQVAEYYELGEEGKIPEENSLKIHITGAEREYYYLPSSLEKVKKGRILEERDTALKSKGLTGARNYELLELSDFRPSELMIAQDWVNQPETTGQEQYLQAEAVYRDFVYEQYTKTDDTIRNLIQKLFWEDYESEQDGIYSALTRIRTVLKSPSVYAKQKEIRENTSDPVSWFLTGDHSGNDMFYASAAVLAFRVHGIPARYAEGYYVSQDQTARESGMVLVSGQNAHAWVEVYFDGIGWLPLDVTPGYYYESVELQQMVGLPDTVQKTAALEPDESEADPIVGGGQKQPESVPKKIAKTGLIILGMAALLLIVLTAELAVLELIHLCWVRYWKKKYYLADMTGRVLIMQRLLYKIVKMRGINGRLGWQTDQTDQEISEKIPEIDPGMYQRACSLMEKSIYGGITLEVYEERALQAFLKKVGQVQKKDTLCTKLKLRYGVFVGNTQS